MTITKVNSWTITKEKANEIRVDNGYNAMYCYLCLENGVNVLRWDILPPKYIRDKVLNIAPKHIEYLY